MQTPTLAGFAFGVVTGGLWVASPLGDAPVIEMSRLHQEDVGADHSIRSADDHDTPASGAEVPSSPAEGESAQDGWEAGSSPDTTALWIERAMQLESILSVHRFLREQSMTMRELEALMSASWLIDDYATLDDALAASPSPNILAAWRRETAFFRYIGGLRKDEPREGESTHRDRVMFHRLVMVPQVRTELERVSSELRQLRLPVEVIEAFRAQVLDNY